MRGVIRLSLWLLAIVAGPTLAEGGSLELRFSRVGMNEFVEATFGHVLGENTVLAPVIVADDRKISVNARGLTREGVRSVAERLLRDHGLAVTRMDGVTYIGARGVASASPDASGSDKPPEVRAVRPPGDEDESTAATGVPSLLDAAVTAGAGDEVRLFQCRFRSCTLFLELARTMFGVDGQLIDDRTMALRGSVLALDRVFEFLSPLDYRVSEVVVNVAVVEVGERDGAATGVGLAFSLLGDRFRVSLGADVVPGANSMRIASGGFEAVVAALKSDSRFQVVTNPSLRSLAGVRALFNAGADVPTLGEVVSSEAGVAQSVVYRASGTIVDALPQIREDGVFVELRVELSTFAATQTGVNNSPTLFRRSLSTAVVIPDAEVLVLGGFNESRSEFGQSGVSWLPWIGTRSNSYESRELLLVVSAKRV